MIHHLPPTDRWPVRLLRARWRLDDGRLALRKGPATVYTRFVSWLDRAFFAWVVRYATHPIVILATILLLAPLIIFASVTSLALILGNYTNVASASVSSIVLMQSLKHHHENKALHAENQRLQSEHARALAALHAKVDALSTTAPAQPRKHRKADEYNGEAPAKQMEQ